MRSLFSILAVVVVTVAAGVAAPAGAITVEATTIEISGLGATEAARIQVLWGEFVAALPTQSSCLLATRPRVVANPTMRPRAAYAPDAATLYVKPGDLDRLVVFHELAHHLDFTCGASEQIGDELREAQGIDRSKPWWLHGAPVTWPAEYFANAVAMAMGEHSRHGVTQESIELVKRWVGMEPAPVADVTLDEPSVATYRPL